MDIIEKEIVNLLKEKENKPNAIQESYPNQIIRGEFDRPHATRTQRTCYHCGGEFDVYIDFRPRDRQTWPRPTPEECGEDG